MSLIQMSLSAGLIVACTLIIRGAALNRLPKKMFLILWGAALLRLLVPFSVPSPVNAVGAIERAVESAVGSIAGHLAGSVTVAEDLTPLIAVETIDNTIEPASVLKDSSPAMTADVTKGAVESASASKDLYPATVVETSGTEANANEINISLVTVVWLTGAAVMFLFFAAAYLKNYKTIRPAVQVSGSEFLTSWRLNHKLARSLLIMRSGEINTPLAFGIIRPKIILPASMDMNDHALLRYVLEHEYLHIRRFDSFWKLAAAFALCVHWFNPLVWVMFILADRDLELTCDETVLRRFGVETRASYAYSLIGMAERRRNFSPLYNGFSKSAAEERIRAIMKYKKSSAFAVILAAVLIIGTTAAFASGASARKTMEEEQTISPPQIYDSGIEYENGAQAPLTVNYAWVDFDDGDYKWPMKASYVTNTGDKNITDFEQVFLAFDKDGNPLQLYWNALGVSQNGQVGSVGPGDDYGIIVDISPVSPKSYSQIKNLDGGMIIKPGQTELSDYSNLFDGWDQSAGTHKAAYIISCIKSVTFENKSVWENPDYLFWLGNYQGKTAAPDALESYYGSTKLYPMAFHLRGNGTNNRTHDSFDGETYREQLDAAIKWMEETEKEDGISYVLTETLPESEIYNQFGSLYLYANSEMFRKMNRITNGEFKAADRNSATRWGMFNEGYQRTAFVVGSGGWLTIEVDCSVTGGEMDVMLVNPSGEIKWQSGFSPEFPYMYASVSAEVGLWSVVTYAGDDFEGRYDITVKQTELFPPAPSVSPASATVPADRYSIQCAGSHVFSSENSSEINIEWEGSGDVAIIGLPIELTEDEIVGMFFTGDWNKEILPDGMLSSFVQATKSPLTHGSMPEVPIGYDDYEGELFYFYIVNTGDVQNVSGYFNVKDKNGIVTPVWKAEE